LFHFFKFVKRELLSIKLEVLAIVCVRDVHPEDIDWDLALFKFLVPLHNPISTSSAFPLAIMESEGEERRKHLEASNGCQQFLDSLR